MRAAFVALVALLVSVPVARASVGSDEEAINAVIMEESAAFRAGDLPRIAACWDQAETTSVIESGHASWGWFDYRDKHLKAELANMQVATYELSDFRVMTSGDMAFATLHYRIVANYRGVGLRANGLKTVVLRKRDGRWRIVHTHTSVVPS
ncbi:MAG: nuclear transport factor 2 family protein [Acidobacteriota bacterium]